MANHILGGAARQHALYCATRRGVVASHGRKRIPHINCVVHFLSSSGAAGDALIELQEVTLRPFRAPGSSLFFASRRLARGETDAEDVDLPENAVNLSLRNSYNHDALSVGLLPGTSWTINKGETWLVVGPNGSGKSCLAQALCGRAMIVKGRVVYPDPNMSTKDIALLSLKSDQALAHLARKVEESSVGWNRLRSSDLVVHKILAADLGIADSCFSDKDGLLMRKVNQLLDGLGLSSLLDKNLSELSTGQLRILCVAKELLKRPRLVILDEPFDGLDKDATRHLAGFLTKAATKTPGSERVPQQFVVISHRASEVRLLPFITNVLEIGEDNRVKSARPVASDATVAGPDWLHSLEPCSFSRLRPFTQACRSIVEEAIGAGKGLESDRNVTLVDMKKVTVSFAGRKPVLKNLDWKITKGQHWAVRGKNGVGKTVLLGMITGETPQVFSQNVSLFGHNRSKQSLEQVRARVTSISPKMQTLFQQSHQSALRTICTGFFGIVGSNCPPTSSDQERRARNLASVFQVEHLMERSFTALSQGQQRIVLVIRALLSCDGSHGEPDSGEPRPPDLVLLDEPMHGLDRAMRERLLQVLSVVKDYSTVVIVTHHEDEVPPFCSKVLQLEKV